MPTPHWNAVPLLQLEPNAIANDPALSRVVSFSATQKNLFSIDQFKTSDLLRALFLSKLARLMDVSVDVFEPGALDEVTCMPLSGGYWVSCGNNDFGDLVLNTLADLRIWKQIAEYRGPKWISMGMNEDMEYYVRFHTGRLEFSGPFEHGDGVPREYNNWSASVDFTADPLEFSAAISHADKLVREFRERLANMLRERLKPELTDRFAQMLTYGLE